MPEPITLPAPNTLKARIHSGVSKFQDAAHRAKVAMYTGCATFMLMIGPAYCDDFEDVVESLVGFIFTLARVVGIVLAVNGAFNWLLANKDENADGQSRGIKLVVVGLALVFLKSLAEPIMKAAGF